MWNWVTKIRAILFAVMAKKPFPFMLLINWFRQLVTGSLSSLSYFSFHQVSDVYFHSSQPLLLSPVNLHHSISALFFCSLILSLPPHPTEYAPGFSVVYKRPFLLCLSLETSITLCLLLRHVLTYNFPSLTSIFSFCGDILTTEVQGHQK